MIKAFLLRFLRENLWIRPAVYSIAAMLLSWLMYYIDRYYIGTVQSSIPDIFLTDTVLARTIMGGLSSSLLTMTTFTFSITMVVLTTYSSQFSPRTVQNFIYAKTTWRVMGIFMGGFIYNTLSLLFMGKNLYNYLVASATVGIIIALVCLGYFALFVHYISNHIQVSTLIEKMTDDAEETVNRYIKMYEENAGNQEQLTTGAPEWLFKSQSSGYIQFIDFKTLSALAQKQEATMEITVPMGEFIHDEQIILRAYAVKRPDFPVRKYIVTGKQKDTRQDPQFALQKLVEVALRAISPGINDPNTAIQNILELGRMLGKISRLPGDTLVFKDSEGTARIYYRLRPFRELLYQTFYQLRHYGKEDISILIAITKSLIIMAELAPTSAHEDIWKMQRYIIEKINWAAFPSMDIEHYEQILDDLTQLTGQEKIEISSLNTFGKTSDSIRL